MEETNSELPSLPILTKEEPIQVDKSIVRLKHFAELLDNKFRIPGTKFKFGIDALIGLIPYAGDIFTFLVSSYLLFLIAKKGAGSKIIVKMVWNIFMDGLIGTIPFIGDIFDFRNKANLKNIALMEGFMHEGKHKGSAWKIFLFILIIILTLIFASLWAIRMLFIWIIT